MDGHDVLCIEMNMRACADIAIARRPQEISEKLHLQTIAKNHIWKVEPSCATSGDGIVEGLTWLGSNVKTAPK